MKKTLQGVGFFFFITSAMFFALAILFLFYQPAVGIMLLIADLTVMFVGAHLIVKAKGQSDAIAIRTCDFCGANGPTRYLEFKECRSYLLVRQERDLEGSFCRECADKVFKSFTTHNLALGWWSIAGIIRTPMLLTMNLVYYIRSRDLRPASS